MRNAGKMLWFVMLVAVLGIRLGAQQSSTEKPASPPSNASAAAWAGDAAAEFLGWRLDDGR